MTRTALKRIRILEELHAAQRNAQELTPAEVLRQRRCRREAAETGRQYEELLREDIEKSQAFWKDYSGDGSYVDILRFRYRRLAKTTVEPLPPGPCDM